MGHCGQSLRQACPGLGDGLGEGEQSLFWEDWVVKPMPAALRMAIKRYKVVHKCDRRDTVARWRGRQ